MKARVLITVSVIVAILLCSPPAWAAMVTQYWGGGDSDRANNTPIPFDTPAAMCGRWDAATKNWADATNVPNTYTALSGGDETMAILRGHFPASGSASVTVMTDVVLHHLFDDVTGPAGTYNQNYKLDADAPRTITLVPSPAGEPPKLGGVSGGTRGVYFQQNVSLAGTDGIQYISAGGTLYLYSECDGLTGTLSLANSGGAFQVLEGASLRGINEVLLTKPGNVSAHLYYTPTSTGVLDRLCDQLVIRGGSRASRFRYAGRLSAGTPSIETIGKFALDSHLVVNVDTYSGSGANYPQLILADSVSGIDRGPYDRGTMLLAPNLTAPHVRDWIIVSHHPFATDTLLPWMAAENGGFCKINSADNSIDLVAMTDAPDDLSSWAPGVDYRLARSFEPLNALGTITINSLALNCSNRVVTIGAGQTLTIASGGICHAPYNNVLGGMRDFTGGAITSGTNALYIISSATSLNADLRFYSELAGAMDVVVAGGPQIVFLGATANTYSGTTYVNSSGFRLTKDSNVIAIPGDLVISRNGVVNLGASQQIAASANVTIHDGGYLDQNAREQTYSGIMTIDGGKIEVTSGTLTLNAGGYGLVFNGGIFSDGHGAGASDLATDVMYASNALRQAAFVCAAGGAFRLVGARTFNVQDAVTLPAASNEMVFLAPLTESGAASLTKIGSGVLEFVSNATYRGGTTISAGTILANNPAGSALGSGPVLVEAAARLSGNGRIDCSVLTNAGTLAPGASIGTLTASNVVFTSGSTLELEWSDGLTNDVLIVLGDVVAHSTPVIKIINVGGLPTIITQVVLRVSGSYTGPPGGYSFDLPAGWTAIHNGSGDLIDLGGGNYGLALIPEPGLWLGLTAALLVICRRRR